MNLLSLFIFNFLPQKTVFKLGSTSAYQTELKNITKNAGVTAVGLFVFNFMSFVNNAIITRWMGAEQYGLYVLATRILEFLFVIAALGLNQSIIRFVSMYQGIGNRALIKGTVVYSFKFSLVSSLVLMAVAFIFSNDISITVFNRPELSFYLRLLLVSIPFTVTISFFANTFVGLKMIKQQTLINNILSPLVFFVFIIMAYSAGYNLTGLIAAQILSVLVVAAIVVFMIWYFFFRNYKTVLLQTEIKKLWSFNVPVYLTNFSATAFRLSPIFILGLYLNNAEIGIYNVSYKISALVVFSMAMFRMIFMPTISGLFAKKDKITIQKLFQTVTRWIFAFSLFISLLILINGDFILSVFGGEFIAGTTVLSILVLGELINSSTGLTGAVIMMSGRSGLALANSVIQFAIVLILAFILIPAYGTIGAALAYTINMLLINAIILIELRYYEKLTPFNLQFLKPLIAGCISYFSVNFLGSIVLLSPIWLFFFKSFLLIGIFAIGLVILRPNADDKMILGLFLNFLKGRKNKRN